MIRPTSSMTRREPSPGRPPFRSFLAQAAQRELAAVEEAAEAAIAAGTVTREQADRDRAAWRAMLDIFSTGAAETHLTLADLEEVAARSLARREQALERCADDTRRPTLQARRDLVWAIHRRISHRRWQVEDLNQRLRDRAEREDIAA